MLFKIEYRITGINGYNVQSICEKHDYQRKILFILLKEGETLADQGKYGLRSSL
jgi:hypothetical protein